jgi:hypothetical protein
MPRNITLTFDDGTTHVYNNAPDDVTPDQIEQRAGKDFSGKKVKAMDGGKKAAPVAAGVPGQPAQLPGMPAEALQAAAAMPGANEQKPEPSVLTDIADTATAAATAVPAAGLLAGGARTLSRMPAIAKTLQGLEATAPGALKTLMAALKNTGQAMIPASGKELAGATALAGGAGAVGGLAKQPIRKASEAASESTGLPAELFSMPADLALTGGASVLGAKGARSIGNAASNAYQTLSGGKVQDALKAMRGEFGDIGPRMTQKAEQVAANAIHSSQSAAQRGQEGAAEAMRVARTKEIEHAATTAEATKKVETAAKGALTQHLGPIRTEDEIGTTLKGTLSEKVNSAYKARTEESEKLYTASKDAAKAMEAQGNNFAKSAPGQSVLDELKALKKPGAGGVAQMTPEREAAIDKIIAAIEGKAAPVKVAPLGGGKVTSKIKTPVPGEDAAPGSMEALTDRLRELRKVDERAGPTEGFAALGKQYANDLAEKLSKAMYQWNPAYKTADTAYQASSAALKRTYQTETMRSATRGEAFDFKKLAAHPKEFASTFFRDSQSVAELKAIAGDDMVRDTAKAWAARQLEGHKGAADVEAWARHNTDWLRAAGIEGDVKKLAADLAGHEAALQRMAMQGKSRAETLKKMAEGGRGNIEQIGKRASTEQTDIVATQEKRVKAADDISKIMQWTKPEKLAEKFEKEIKPNLSPLMSPEEMAKLEQHVKAIDSTYAGQEKAQKTAKAIARALGLGAAIGLGGTVGKIF